MFTVVIPTHNRQSYLKRIVSYYSLFPFNVIVVDSTEDKFDLDFPKNFKYIHSPKKKFAEKIILASNVVEDDFIALCPDDDFLLPEALICAYAKMFLYPNVSISFGRYVGFKEGICNAFYSISPVFKKPIEKGDRYCRLNSFMKNYHQILWSLYRKDVLMDAFRAIEKAEYQNDNFIEITISAIAIYKGDINFVSGVWGARELSEADHWGARHEAISYSNTEDARAFVETVGKLTSHDFAKLALESYLSGGCVVGKIRRLVSDVQRKIRVNNSGSLELVANVLSLTEDNK